MQLDIAPFICSKDIEVAYETLKVIDSWVESSIKADDEGFIVLGV
jgi:hypothetical protein